MIEFDANDLLLGDELDNPNEEHDDDGEGRLSPRGDEAIEVPVKPKGGAAKRVSKPRPKLDYLRLISERGLTDLMKKFESVNFPTKSGSELHNLKLIKGMYEEWANHLFSKLPLKEAMEKLEELGHKRQVQVTMSRLRKGDLTTLTTADGQRHDAQSPSSPTKNAAEPSAPPRALLQDDDEDDEWAAMMLGQPTRQEVDLDEARFDAMLKELEENDMDNDDEAPAVAVRSAEPQPPPPQEAPPVELTEEQLARIKANREKAMAIRLAKTQAQPTSLNNSLNQPTEDLH